MVGNAAHSLGKVAIGDIKGSLGLTFDVAELIEVWFVMAVSLCSGIGPQCSATCCLKCTPLRDWLPRC